ncbi:serotonin N-acetyltransferase-like isoform X2 [Glandiceps talaboti]
MAQSNVEVRPISPRDLKNAHEIEKTGYPPDERALLDSFTRRQSHTPDLFLARYHDGKLVGYACSSRYHGDTYTQECLKEYVDGGDAACLHSLCIAAEERRKGYGKDLLKRYVNHIQKTLPEIQRILLLCKEHLQSFYKSVGFTVKGPSSVQIGDSLWYECCYEIHKNI